MYFVNVYQSFFEHSAFMRRIVTRHYYQLISRYLDHAEVSFMNYGYAGLGSSPNTLLLNASDEPHRLPIQLYHHLASSVNLEGQDILDVSCGRGGGASFVRRYHQPRSLVGIDHTGAAITYCRRKHHHPGLSFLQCDAENIVYGSECFDAILNVEASHLYGCMETFLAEVKRVLRPGGTLLLADKRTRSEIRLFRRQVSACGFQVVSDRDISANVLQSIQQQRESRNRMLQNILPPHLLWLARSMIGADGSHLAQAIARGETVYLSLVLRKA
jgi:ubiquinone/menaquinone biosynthesis C-methylase UbiE